MVFMAASCRAAEIARQESIDASLHLNLTTAFTERSCSSKLLERQATIASFLTRHKFAQTLFNPLLISSFDYVVAAQFDEYRRLYGREPNRIDGHHHMHLCTNVLLQRLLPAGTLVRRSFTFQVDEKGWINRTYRRMVDSRIAKRHRVADYLFSLTPLEPTRLRRILSLARSHVVEVETHPANREEHRFLTGSPFAELIRELCQFQEAQLPTT